MKTRILALISVLALGVSAAAAAQPSAGWLRYPSISPDGKTIVFTHKGDLYRVAAAGGTAIPLTTHQAHDFMPVWSRDGRQIAFASDRYGNFDVFVIPAEGGEARRLTFHSAAEYPYTFTGDGTAIVFGAARMDTAANRLFPTGSQPELYQVPTAGGRPVQLLTTPAEDVKFSRNGQFVIYHDKKGGENVWRKHHTSAITRDVWIHDTQAGTHRKITTFSGEDRSPIFADGDKAFYYLSEESGTFNVHKMGIDGGKSQQVTSFKNLPVRFLSSSDAGILSFGYDGDLYTMKPGSSPQKVAVAITADAKANRERVVPVTSGAREMAVSPSGKEIAFVARGDVFVTSVEGGVTKRVTATPEEERGIGFSPDGKALVYASERNGRWAVYEARKARDEEPYFYASTLLKETPLVANAQQNTQPRYSPDGKELAYIEDRNTLRILTLESKQARTLLTDKEIFGGGGGHHFLWSPDSKWLLFDYSIPGIAPGEVGIVRADGKSAPTNLTLSGFDDARAKWILGGKAMLWFSTRDGLKSVAQSGSAQRDVYAMFFTKEAWDRFRLTKEEYALVKEAEEKKDKEKPKADAEKDKKDASKDVKIDDVVVDFDGLEIRKARLTIHSSLLGDALVGKDGETLYYLARFEKNANLWSTNLRTRETKMLVALNAAGGSMEWDKEQKNIFLLADGTLSKIDPAGAKRESVSFSSEVVADTEAERAAMFDHVWRRTRDTFYSAGFHGVDWVGIRPIYAKYLPHIGNNYEFSEMLSEMLGELNISHSGSSVLGLVADRRRHRGPRGLLRPDLRWSWDEGGGGRQRRPARQGRDGRQAGHDHRVGRRPGGCGRHGHRAGPEPKGRQAHAACRGGRREEDRGGYEAHHAGRREPVALRALGAEKPGRSQPPQQRAVRLHPRAGHERRRVSHDVRGSARQVRPEKGPRRRHAVQRRRRSRGRPRDVPERQTVLQLHHRHAQQRVRAEFPVDQAQRVARQRGELQRRALLRLHVQDAQDRAACRHAGARHVHVRRLGVAARRRALGRARHRREGLDHGQVPREPADRA